MTLVLLTATSLGYSMLSSNYEYTIHMNSAKSISIDQIDQLPLHTVVLLKDGACYPNIKGVASQRDQKNKHTYTKRVFLISSTKYLSSHLSNFWISTINLGTSHAIQRKKCDASLYLIRITPNALEKEAMQNGFQARHGKVVKESDWQDYFGSSDAVKMLVEESGRDRFERKILRLCNSKGEMSYWEMWYQMTNHVLLRPDKYYNAFVGGKIHRKHVLKNESNTKI